MISELFEQALKKAGTCQELGSVLDLCPSDVSKVRNGTKGMPLDKMDKLVSFLGYTLVPADHEKKLKDALKTISQLWAAADQ
jgi:hypothetical protein